MPKKTKSKKPIKVVEDDFHDDDYSFIDMVDFNGSELMLQMLQESLHHEHHNLDKALELTRIIVTHVEHPNRTAKDVFDTYREAVKVVNETSQSIDELISGLSHPAD